MELRVARDGTAIFAFAPEPTRAGGSRRSLGTPPAHGALFLAAQRGAYIPDKNFVGTDTFSYLVNSADAVTDVKIRVEVFNPDEQATPFSDHAIRIVSEDTATSIDLADAFRGSADGWELLVPPTSGKAELDGGSLTYVPAKEWSGITELALRRKGLEEALILELVVQAVDDPPTLDVVGNARASSGAPATIAFMVSDVDTAEDALEVKVVSGDSLLLPDSALKLTHAGERYRLVVTPAVDTAGATDLTIEVSDGMQTTRSVITVEVGVGPGY